MFKILLKHHLLDKAIHDVFDKVRFNFMPEEAAFRIGASFAHLRFKTTVRVLNPYRLCEVLVDIYGATMVGQASYNSILAFTADECFVEFINEIDCDAYYEKALKHEELVIFKRPLLIKFYGTLRWVVQLERIQIIS